MQSFRQRRNASGYRQVLGAALVCVLALLALHHLAPHADDTFETGCPLCVLFSTALLVPLVVVANVAVARTACVAPRSSIPPLRTDTWSAWSHRGPPLHS